MLPDILMLPVLERMARDSKGNAGWLERLDANDTVEFEFTVQTDQQRLLDSVLMFWDLRDKDGWKPILDICVDDEGSMEADAASDDLKKWLRKFTASDLFKAVRDARPTPRRILPVFLRTADLSLPPCRGWIDIWFRDKDGAFRIVAFHTDQEISLAEAVKSRKPFYLQQLRARSRAKANRI